MVAVASPIASKADSPLLSPEESAKHTVYEFYFDSRLGRNIGIIVSRIIIENETADFIQGYLADSSGNRLWMVDNVQVVLAKFVLNNTATTRWELADWVHDGFFIIEKPDDPGIVAVRIYIGPSNYVIDYGTPTISQSWVFINPAWTEFSFSYNSGTLAQGASSASPMSQNPYDPRTYEPTHCTYIVDLYGVYNHCAKLFIKTEQEDKTKATSSRQEYSSDELTPTNSTDSVATSSGNVSIPSQPPSAIDPIERSPELQCHASSGIFFGSGVNPMTCSVEDASGNMRVRTLNITVIGTMPELTVPSDVSLYSATNATATNIVFSMNTTDIMDPALSVTCHEPEQVVLSGEFVPLRITTVDCTWSDSSQGPIGTNFVIVRTYLGGLE